jgi:hypothetical protein
LPFSGSAYVIVVACFIEMDAIEWADLRRTASYYIGDYGTEAPAHLRAEAFRSRRNGDDLAGEAWDEIADVAELLLGRVLH